MHRLRLRTLISLITTVLVAQTGFAGGLSDGQESKLGGHTFMPSQYITEPWVTTAFHNSTGGGVAIGLKTPFYDRDGREIFVLKTDIFYASLNLAFQQNLGGTVALGAQIGSKVRSGTNSLAFVNEGANLGRQMNLWAKKRVVRRDHTQLTLGLDWSYQSVLVVTPRDFAHDIIAGEGLANSTLMRWVKSWTTVATAEYAHAFSSSYGVRANARVGLHEDPYANGTTVANQRLGVLLEMDLAPQHEIPLGLTLGHTQGFSTSDPNAGLSGSLFGIWFTGRAALRLGTELGFMTVPDRNLDTRTNVIFGNFSVRYYF